MLWGFTDPLRVVNDLLVYKGLRHCEEADAFADAGHQGAHKWPEAKGGVNWHVAMRPGKRKALDLNDPCRAIEKQFGQMKAHNRGLANNTAQLKTLFMLSNLWMVQGKLMGGVARVRPKSRRQRLLQDQDAICTWFAPR